MSIGGRGFYTQVPVPACCLSTLIFQTTIFDSFEQKECLSLCHGDWSMASPPTCQEVIDVTSTRPLSKDFDVKRFGLNTTSRIKAFVFRFVSIPAKRIRTSNANAIIHSSFFIYSIIWGKDSENLRTSQI